MVQWETKDKTFLITGGASGLGAAYAEAFLKDGAKKVAILDVAEELGKAKAESLNQSHRNKVIFVKCDVSKEDDIDRAFDEVVAQFKQIDVIINNAGIMVDAPNMWRTACDVNWQGVLSFTLKGIRHMRKDEGGAGGTIINKSSVAGLIRFPCMPVYSASKLAVMHFSQNLSVPPFYDRTGVRVLVMCPGPTDTPLLQGLVKRAYDPILGKQFEVTLTSEDVVFQKIESMVAAFLHMYKNGAPGSIWVSTNNKPAEDVTLLVDSSFRTLEDKITDLESN